MSRLHRIDLKRYGFATSAQVLLLLNKSLDSQTYQIEVPSQANRSCLNRIYKFPLFQLNYGPPGTKMNYKFNLDHFV